MQKPLDHVLHVLVDLLLLVPLNQRVDSLFEFLTLAPLDFEILPNLLAVEDLLILEHADPVHPNEDHHGHELVLIELVELMVKDQNDEETLNDVLELEIEERGVCVENLTQMVANNVEVTNAVDLEHDFPKKGQLGLETLLHVFLSITAETDLEEVPQPENDHRLELHRDEESADGEVVELLLGELLGLRLDEEVLDHHCLKEDFEGKGVLVDVVQNQDEEVDLLDALLGRDDVPLEEVRQVWDLVENWFLGIEPLKVLVILGIFHPVIKFILLALHYTQWKVDELIIEQR